MTSHVAELQETINTTTLKLVLLAIVTGGIYLLLWCLLSPLATL